MEWESLIWFLITLVLMGFFAGFEMAFYSANRVGLELRKKQQQRSHRLISQYDEHPDRLLATTLLGFTFFLVLLALQLSGVTQFIWSHFQIGNDIGRILTEIVLVTLIVLYFVEFIPRAIFRAQANRLLLATAPLFHLFFIVLEPVAVSLMNFSEWLLVYVFNVRVDPHKETLTRSDLKGLFWPHHKEEREERSAQLMENAQELPKVRIRQCLVPRKEIVGIEQGATIEQLKQQFIDTKLSRLVVYNKNIDHIVGYVHQLDLFAAPTSINEILYPIPAVPESMSAADLISKFTRERKSIAWVVDEFGGTAGIITMEDVLEELFGEIQDEYDTEQLLEKKINDEEFLFSGRIELDYLAEKYGLEWGQEEAETLSGYIIHYHEKIPSQKERIIIDGYEFEIVQVSDTRIETVKLKRLR